MRVPGFESIEAIGCNAEWKWDLDVKEIWSFEFELH